MADKNMRRLLELNLKKMRISSKVISKQFDIKELIKGKIRKYIVRGDLVVTSLVGVRLCRNKEITKILLRRNKIHCPVGITVTDQTEVKKLFKSMKMRFPVVCKPIDASCGHGLTMDIDSFEQLSRAIETTKNYIKRTSWDLSGKIVIEEMAQGFDHRLLVLDGKCLAVAQKLPAHVVGDGVSTISELIESFNRTSTPVCIIKVDKEVRDNLRKNQVRLSTVLEPNRFLQLRQISNLSGGGRAYDYTEKASRRFKSIAENCAKFLGVRLAGVDLMTQDITSEDPRQPYWVIEVNATPGFDMHEKPLITGKAINVTQKIIKAYLGLS